MTVIVMTVFGKALCVCVWCHGVCVRVRVCMRVCVKRR